MIEEQADLLGGLGRWERNLPALRARFAAADPFPHLVFDDFVSAPVYQRAAAEFPSLHDTRWTSYVHINENKYANRQVESWGPTLRALGEALNGPRFVHFLEGLTGIPDLLADRTMDGGGLHQSPRGGFLNVHADFTTHHTMPRLRRRVNVLLYFNDRWCPEWGGELELWAADMTRAAATIAPIGNRMLVFATDERSFHGHPEPLRCPDGEARRSLALYYFTDEDRPMVRSTNYQARPGDGAKRIGIYLDKGALRAYDAMKRRWRFTDETISRWLRRGR